MTRKYYLVIKGNPGSYSAYVPELPTILITGQSLDEISERATEAVRLFWETVRTDLSPTSMLREIEVDLPAYGQAVLGEDQALLASTFSTAIGGWERIRVG